MDLPGSYALGANINIGSRKGVLFLDLTTRLLHIREISGPQTVSIPRLSSRSNLLLLLILTGFSQAGGGGRGYRERRGNLRLTLGRRETQCRRPMTSGSFLDSTHLPRASSYLIPPLSLRVQPTALPSPSSTLPPPEIGPSTPSSPLPPVPPFPFFPNPSSSKNHS